MDRRLSGCTAAKYGNPPGQPPANPTSHTVSAEATSRRPAMLLVRDEEAIRAGQAQTKLAAHASKLALCQTSSARSSSSPSATPTEARRCLATRSALRKPAAMSSRTATSHWSTSQSRVVARSCAWLTTARTWVASADSTADLANGLLTADLDNPG